MLGRPVQMTPQRVAVLRFIVVYHQEHKYSPSYKEICAAIDGQRQQEDPHRMSSSAVKFHLISLIKSGLLVGEIGIARGYSPTESGVQYMKEWKEK
jgi:hypothetical protein